MKILTPRFLIAFILIAFFQSFCRADTLDDVKAVVLKSYLNHLGKGSVIAGPFTIEEVIKRDTGCEKNCAQASSFVADKIRSIYKEGDIIIFIRTDDASWSNRAGRAGYIVIRGQEIIYRVFTVVN